MSLHIHVQGQIINGDNKQEIKELCAGEITKEVAMAVAQTEWWKEEGWTDEEIARLQLGQDRLVMNFPDFQRAVESALGRPVWTHEFADTASLLAELDGKVKVDNPVEHMLDKLEEMAPGKTVIPLVVE